LLATAAAARPPAAQLAVSLAHAGGGRCRRCSRFKSNSPWLRALAGVSAEPSVHSSTSCANAADAGNALGLSGPAIFEIVGLGRAAIARFEYQFPLLETGWQMKHGKKILQEFQARRRSAGARLVLKFSAAR